MKRSPWRPGGWADVLCSLVASLLAVWALGWLLVRFGVLVPS